MYNEIYEKQFEMFFNGVYEPEGKDYTDEKIERGEYAPYLNNIFVGCLLDNLSLLEKKLWFCEDVLGKLGKANREHKLLDLDYLIKSLRCEYQEEDVDKELTVIMENALRGVRAKVKTEWGIDITVKVEVEKECINDNVAELEANYDKLIERLSENLKQQLDIIYFIQEEHTSEEIQDYVLKRSQLDKEEAYLLQEIDKYEKILKRIR